MIIEKWKFENEREKNIIIVWLSNIYKSQFESGLANITHEDNEKNILTFRLIKGV